MGAGAAANATLSRLSSRLGAAYQNASDAVNETLYDLAHPLQAIREELNLTGVSLNLSMLADTAALRPRLNASSVAALASSWGQLRAAGLPLPNITSVFAAVAPAAGVSGLQRGAPNAVQGMVQMAQAMWANKLLRGVFLAVVRIAAGAIATQVITG